MSAPTVFISYSHRDEAWKDKLLPQLLSLERAGIRMQVWHDRKIDGGDKWYPEIEAGMARAAAAVLLISSDFLSSPFCVQQEVPNLLKRQEEQGMLLVPVLLRPCLWEVHRWLKDRQMIPRDGKSVAIDFSGDHADTVFAAVARRVLAHFEQLADPASVDRLATQLTPADASIIPSAPVVLWLDVPADHIDLTRLPETGSTLFGRDAQLAVLDKAWASAHQVGVMPSRILIFTAHGGVGKSTLVNRWLAELARDRYRGATRVFGWSFYSQGVRQETAASADTFIETALGFFGDADPAAGSPWDKGARLARLIGSQRALLVLDGLEPLQSAHAFDRGELRDPALESLLRGLARQSAGLCVITTREPLPALAKQPGVAMYDLEQITPEAGRALLRTARVVATDAELEALATRFGPHALAVCLLGVYLYERPGHGIGPALVLGELPGKEPIDCVLAGFEHWLGEGPELETLRLLGLFDRPADAGCLRALRMAPVIHGLTDSLVGLDEVGWHRVIARLEHLLLISARRGESEILVEAHPLVRDHFARLLKSSEAWRAAHQRLYEHLVAATKEGDQPTLQDLQPLYQAVAHGCEAGLQQKACETFHDRIHQGRNNYAASQLGALGQQLGAAACFFETPWNRVSDRLTEPAQGWLLNVAAIVLQALGRLTLALEPMRAGLHMRVNHEDFGNAAVSAGNLSELELALGEVARAVQDANLSVTYADRAKGFPQVLSRTSHARALHQAGRQAEAEACFRDAEEVLAEIRPQYPLLYSAAGFGYCEVLLNEAERDAWHALLRRSGAGAVRDESRSASAKNVAVCLAVSDRATRTLTWDERNNSLIGIALNHLTLGRAALYRAQISRAYASAAAKSGQGDAQGNALVDLEAIAVARREIDAAVVGLRRSGFVDNLPPGLLTRAWYSFAHAKERTLLDKQHESVERHTSAQRDLDEVEEIAERGPMPLFLADLHLHRARLFHAVTSYPWTSPHADLAEARRLIEKHGYWRRKEELEDAEEAAKGW